MHAYHAGLARPCWLALLLLLISPQLVVASEAEPFAENDTISSPQLAAAVLQRNPSLFSMNAAWQAAQARIAPAKAFDDPKLSYALAPETQGLTGQDVGQKIMLSQKLPWPGKRGLRGKSAQGHAEASRERVALARLQLLETTYRLYADWFYVHEARRINELNRQLWEEFRSIAELKYSTGVASKQDALQAAVEQTMLEHQAIVLRRRQHNIQSRINRLLNLTPERHLPPPAPIGEPVVLPVAAVLHERAMSLHPSVLALNAELRAQQAQTRLARRSYFPDFNVNVGHNSLWAQKEKRYTVGVSLNLPLGWRKRRAVVNESRARSLQLKWKIRDKLMEIASAVQQAYDSVEESSHVLKLYRDKLVPLAEEGLQAARSEYQSGQGSFLRLVAADKNLYETSLNRIKALSDYHQRLAVLVSRVGDPRLVTGQLSETKAAGETIK